LIDVQSTLTPDARTQLGADWAGLTDKAGFCRGVLALLATKKRAAVSDALLDGGFDGATDYARVLYHRVAKLVAATEGAPLATKGPVADAIAEVLMALSAPRSVAPSMA
jgi:hypothetical protein